VIAQARRARCAAGAGGGVRAEDGAPAARPVRRAPADPEPRRTRGAGRARAGQRDGARRRGAEVRAQGARDLIVTRGAEGVLYTRGSAGEDIVRLYAHGADVVDVTGAGDAFAAAVCWSLMQDGDDLELACRRGLKLSALTLGVAETVHPRLGPTAWPCERRSHYHEHEHPGLNMQAFLQFSPEVQAARAAGKPVVALESTIISHGMPYPQNVQTAREVEQVIRDAGAVPATIAIIDGRICIGLADDQLELLGQAGMRSRSAAATWPTCCRNEEARRHHRGRHHDLREAGRHRSLRHRRHRRRAPRRRDQLRHLGRPAGTGADRRGRRLRGREVDPRHRPDARIPRDPRRAGGERRPAGLPRLLHARQRLQGRLPARHAGSRRASSAPSGSSAWRAAWWSAIRCRRHRR
jgi:hypothetical protein